MCKRVLSFLLVSAVAVLGLAPPVFGGGEYVAVKQNFDNASVGATTLVSTSSTKLSWPNDETPYGGTNTTWARRSADATVLEIINGDGVNTSRFARTNTAAGGLFFLQNALSFTGNYIFKGRFKVTAERLDLQFIKDTTVGNNSIRVWITSGGVISLLNYGETSTTETAVGTAGGWGYVGLVCDFDTKTFSLHYSESENQLVSAGNLVRQVTVTNEAFTVNSLYTKLSAATGAADFDDLYFGPYDDGSGTEPETGVEFTGSALNVGGTAIEKAGAVTAALEYKNEETEPLDLLYIVELYNGKKLIGVSVSTENALAVGNSASLSETVTVPTAADYTAFKVKALLWAKDVAGNYKPLLPPAALPGV